MNKLLETLKMRLDRLEKEKEINAPRLIIKNEVNMIVEVLNEIKVEVEKNLN